MLPVKRLAFDEYLLNIISFDLLTLIVAIVHAEGAREAARPSERLVLLAGPLLQFFCVFIVVFMSSSLFRSFILMISFLFRSFILMISFFFQFQSPPSIRFIYEYSKFKVYNAYVGRPKHHFPPFSSLSYIF